MAGGATLYTTLEPCSHHGRTPPVRRRGDRGRGCPGGRRHHRPRPAGARAGRDAALREAGHRGRGRGVRGRGGRAARPVPEAPPDRPAVGGAEDGRSRSTGGPPRRTARAVGSPARRPGPTPTGCGRAPTRCSSGPGPCGPTTPPSPCGSIGSHRTASRCGWCSGRRPPGARVHPALELSGDLGGVLDELGSRGALQVLVEGGATVAHDLHAAGLVDRYVLYLAPALSGGDDGRPVFAGPGAATIERVLARPAGVGRAPG